MSHPVSKCFFKVNALEIEFDKTNEMLEEFPDVFVGNKSDFDDLLMVICGILGISKSHILKYWNISDTIYKPDDKYLFQRDSISTAGGIIY